MKLLITFALFIFVLGCYSGKDPVNDYPGLKEFVPEYEPLEPKVFNFETQYGISENSLVYEYTNPIRTNADDKFETVFKLSGAWAEKYQFVLMNRDSAQFIQLEITPSADLTWKISGRVARDNISNSTQSVYLELYLQPQGEVDSAFLKAVESLVIEPLMIEFLETEEP